VSATVVHRIVNLPSIASIAAPMPATSSASFAGQELAGIATNARPAGSRVSNAATSTSSPPRARVLGHQALAPPL
jgi:hypothetical protein